MSNQVCQCTTPIQTEQSYFFNQKQKKVTIALDRKIFNESAEKRKFQGRRHRVNE